MKKIALGVLLGTMALHPAFADKQTVSTHWELHAFADVDGERKVDKRIIATNFVGPEDCIKQALTLPAPPPAKEIQGHTIVYGYVCQKIEDEGMETSL